MKTYARVAGGVVLELFSTALAINSLFPPGITWVDVTSVSGIAIGWLQIGNGFTAPAAQTPTIPVVTLASVQAQLTALQSQVNAIAAAGGH